MANGRGGGGDANGWNKVLTAVVIFGHRVPAQISIPMKSVPALQTDH